ncbi:hypothetical protein EJ06DRAFT_126279 [Trichodelitschia bisporula]|uniref:Uncharacterized protein n=1 Tax=Trichodelitschia bisporula TaxID=703511 RepID=A0A6G1HQN7_9PEZI|nr:hypothetical protein EJ06DRAFT_126279 [Trichodelitschia bisporula]
MASIPINSLLSPEPQSHPNNQSKQAMSTPKGKEIASREPISPPITPAVSTKDSQSQAEPCTDRDPPLYDINENPAAVPLFPPSPIPTAQASSPIPTPQEINSLVEQHIASQPLPPNVQPPTREEYSLFLNASTALFNPRVFDLYQRNPQAWSDHCEAAEQVYLQHMASNRTRTTRPTTTRAPASSSSLRRLAPARSPLEARRQGRGQLLAGPAGQDT